MPHHLDLTPETNWGVLVRRTRYFVAVTLSALLFCTLGWFFASPLPEMDGVSLLVWQNHGLMAAIGLAGVLLVATAFCTVLVHPDAPHMGLFCAMLGLAGLSIKGGTIHMMLQYGENSRLLPTLPPMTWTKLSQMLIVESVQWAFLFLIAEVFARLLHDRFFANTRWITRASPESGKALLVKSRLGLAVHVSHGVSHTLGTNKLQGWITIPLALLWSSGVGLLMLYVLMQSEQKGQVLMACFAAFLISTMAAHLTFPRVPLLALMLAVPLTGAIGYLWASHVVPAEAGGAWQPGFYPGHATFFAMRALPIDYVSAGIPGAILGYYWALHWSLQPTESAES